MWLQLQKPAMQKLLFTLRLGWVGVSGLLEESGLIDILIQHPNPAFYLQKAIGILGLLIAASILYCNIISTGFSLNAAMF